MDLGQIPAHEHHEDPTWGIVDHVFQHVGSLYDDAVARKDPAEPGRIGGAYVRPEKVPTWPEAMSLAQGRCIQT